MIKYFVSSLLLISLVIFDRAFFVMTADASTEQAQKTERAPKTEKAQKVEKFFNGLNKDSMHLLDDFYDERVIFVDPLGEHSGIEEIRAYYSKLYENVISIEFEFTDHIESANKLVSFWTMRFRSRGLRGGELIEVEGNSVFEFGRESKKVIYHRDYFDMGEFIYENVPLVSSLVHYVKRRLNSE